MTARARKMTEAQQLLSWLDAEKIRVGVKDEELAAWRPPSADEQGHRSPAVKAASCEPSATTSQQARSVRCKPVRRPTRGANDPHPQWQEWRREHEQAARAFRAVNDGWLAGEPIDEGERQRLWTVMMRLEPRRRLERVNWPLPVVQCGVCRASRDRDLWPLLVQADYDPRKALTLLPSNDDPPWPMWRLNLLRIVHNRPLATRKELERLEQA